MWQGDEEFWTKGTTIFCLCVCMYVQEWIWMSACPYVYTINCVFLEGDFTGIYKVPLGSHPMMHLPFEPSGFSLFCSLKLETGRVLLGFDYFLGRKGVYVGANTLLPFWTSFLSQGSNYEMLWDSFIKKTNKPKKKKETPQKTNALILLMLFEIQVGVWERSRGKSPFRFLGSKTKSRNSSKRRKG